MSFFEDAISSAKDFGSAVSRKTGEFVDVTKLKVTAADISSEINSRYKALGKAIYEAKTAGADLDSIADKYISDIDALQDRLDEINDRINGMRNKASCSSCGASVEQRSQYCPRCGARLGTRRATARQKRQDAPAPEVITVEGDEE